MAIDALDYCGQDMARLTRRKKVRARKLHGCCECRQPIRIGDDYDFVELLDDNSGWNTYRTCLPCASLRDELFENGFVLLSLAELAPEFRDDECLDLRAQIQVFEARFARDRD